MEKVIPGASKHQQTPLVWLLLGDKQGDNGQVEAIVERLGWPCVHKYVHMLPEYVLGKPRFRATLSHLDLSRSAAIEAPWPDIIITVGRRPSMAALWVRKQSGNRTRIVLVGKPTGQMSEFDLVIASRENQLPPLKNLITIPIPLMRANPAAIEEEALRWQKQLARYRRPMVAIFVGGETNPFRMDDRVVERMVTLVKHIQTELMGTAYVVTSRRTRPKFVEKLEQLLPAETPLFVWSADNNNENPYKALLGTADAFIVTGDSISMMVEVISLQKPLAIFPLPTGMAGGLDQLRRSFASWLFNPRLETRLDRARHRLARLIHRIDYFKLISSTRDFRQFHRSLVDKGLAVWASEPFAPPAKSSDDDLAMVVTRIRSLP